MTGERRASNMFGSLRLPEAGFGQDMYGRWFVRPPGGNKTEVLPEEVQEHADETISVKNVGGWELKRGVWSRAARTKSKELSLEGAA